MSTTPDAVLEFWFGDSDDDAGIIRARSSRWFGGSESLDREIRLRFAGAVDAASTECLPAWGDEPRAALARIILIDQFRRNIHRGQAAAFSADPLARRYAESGIAAGQDQALRPIERVFFYLPLEHAENIEAQRHCVQLFERLLADADPALHTHFKGFLDYAIAHRRVIERFGRFPHRNAALGRPTTPAEAQFLTEPGSAF